MRLQIVPCRRLLRELVGAADDEHVLRARRGDVQQTILLGVEELDLRGLVRLPADRLGERLGGPALHPS